MLKNCLWKDTRKHYSGFFQEGNEGLENIAKQSFLICFNFVCLLFIILFYRFEFQTT